MESFRKSWKVIVEGLFLSLDSHFKKLWVMVVACNIIVSAPVPLVPFLWTLEFLNLGLGFRTKDMDWGLTNKSEKIK